jgi:TonB family protein
MRIFGFFQEVFELFRQCYPLRVFPRSVLLLLITLIIAVPAGLAQSGSIEKELTTALRGKVLTLKTFTKRSHLEFDETGQIKNKGEDGSWTLYGQVLVIKVDVSESRVRLSGDRIVHHWDSGIKKLVASRSDMKVDIDIDIHKGAGLNDATAAIGKVFAGAEGLVAYVPEYWRQYIGGKPVEKPPCSSGKHVRTGGNVMAASLLKQVRPIYPPEAKGFLVQGVVLLEAQINENGDIDSLAITAPAGAGLDESAVEAVSQWKYKPTTLDGTPVCTITTITVNYAFSR